MFKYKQQYGVQFRKAGFNEASDEYSRTKDTKVNSYTCIADIQRKKKSCNDDLYRFTIMHAHKGC